MKRQVLSQDEVQKVVQSNFVPVRIGAASNLKLMDQYGAIGAPSFVILAPDGQKLGILGGSATKSRFLQFLDNFIRN